MKRYLWGGLVLLLALVLGAGGYYLYRHATPYQKLVDHGPSPEARANPYLAAEMFLRERGLKVQHANSLDVLASLPPAGNSLLLLGERSNMSPPQVDQLLEWARAGGRLLFVAEALWDEDSQKSGDLLLDRVQIHQQLSQDLDEPPEPEADDAYPKLTKVYLEDEQAPAYISFDTDFHLDDPQSLAQSWANSGVATHMIQLEYGKGAVIVLTDADIWKAPAIGLYDNAWLLWYLNTDSAVTLLFNTDHPDLWQLLWRYFPQALVALALLLGLWLWQAGMRHGPLLAPAPKARRQLREHLRASADFLLRHAGQGALLQALQLDIRRRARRRHPGFEQLPAEAQWDVLALLSQQPVEAIRQALQPLSGQRLSSVDFSHQVARLQTLRNAL
ncbi:DUF4350 domain-containing protein [Pseudomonas protegens]|uniref:DUF4350 domain-containing protein n=1 Tax=Pseudomonas protegens TaxID=380021 RepID=UPI001B31882A|nr:DUF4350 domain-containing protein [Pseudomonas protegens]MBP5125036.1 DUF4350 domain-containing protein [Pseudomonas protegens]QTU08618.1 DUF4350 domain-containing protein [Pseudomonas protegens]QTU14927.1 DUF4350 domain-containing protein [Pseudomonas protegens]QTU37692.1 DUF4350 domain-containing protein [Pseudomonas protegens]